MQLPLRPPRKRKWSTLTSTLQINRPVVGGAGGAEAPEEIAAQEAIEVEIEAETEVAIEVATEAETEVAIEAEIR